MECFDKSCPVETKKIHNSGKSKLWLTADIVNSSKELRDLYWLKRYSNDANFHDMYKIKKSAHTRNVNEAKRNYYSRKISDSNSKSKTMWNIVNSHRNLQKVNKPISLNIEGNIIREPVDIANQFGHFFSTYALKCITDKYDSGVHSCPMSGPVSNRSMFLSPASREDVCGVMKSLKSQYSSGTDGLSSYIVKTVADEILPHLVFLINKSLELSSFPVALKKAVVIPIHKGMDANKISNYRPISLLNTFSKIIEKVVYNKLMSYIGVNNLLSDRQHGFRANCNTETACVELVQCINDRLDRKDFVVGIFYDMSRAFDSLNMGILLSKLTNMGIRGPVLEWVRSYLAHRKLCVRIDNRISDEFDLELGVPQGSVLGPLLFLLYINDLPELIRDGFITLYADDICVLVSASSESSVIGKVSSVNETVAGWCSDNRLLLNDSKTVYVNFHNRRPLVFDSGTANSVELSDSVRYLGIILDCRMDYDCYIDHICKKLNSTYYVMSQLKGVLSADALLSVYYALVYSVLSYNTLIWGAAVNAGRVLVCQKRFIRLMFHIPNGETCRTTFIDGKILTLPSIFIYKALCYTKSNMHLFETNSSIHGYGTRNVNGFRGVKHNTTKYERSPLYLCNKLYNVLPERIRGIHDDKLFKSQVRAYLCERCCYSLTEYMM